ncbi:MAG: hypothetical protein HYZ27_04455 [Deltaproteobacteria bacterium]|nr:hypothetical protein [Deltaproteobacteria bacterium]
MTDKKLESFKISESRKPSVSAPKRAQAAANQRAEAEKYSLGFGRIEGILETDDAATVSDNLNKLLQTLEDMERQARSAKDKAAAKKAIVAVERTADLLDYLFQTKAAMQSSPRT